MTTTTPSGMTVEAARQVRWLRNNHRPLGELLDEGYLNEGRLAWAAEKAYNPELKAAAQVLLDHVRGAQWSLPNGTSAAHAGEPLKLALTEAEARATPWPFAPHRDRPMGKLSDAHQLSLKDLGYAIENAWDRRVRDAAILLMAQRLRQEVTAPTDADGPPKEVSGGRGFSERQQFVWTMVGGLLFGSIGTLVIGAFIWSIIETVQATRVDGPQMSEISTSTFIAMGIVLGLFFAALFGVEKLLDWIADHIERKIRLHRRGQEGEERVLAAIRRNLDGTWTVFRNLELPTRKGGDLDLVLVGPSGVWLLEVKTYTGDYRNYGEHWDYRAGKRWKPMRKRGPRRQARANAVRLANFLRADGLRQFVEPAVVWANETSAPDVEQPTVPVWTLDRLPDELGNLDRGRRLAEAHQAQIVAKLSDLCAQQTRQGAAEPAFNHQGDNRTV